MLKRVSIQNFKSLKDVTLNLQKVNLLIGPNNSGKTNFLKALEYIRDNYRNPPKRSDLSLTYNYSGENVTYTLISDDENSVHINKIYDFKNEEVYFRVNNGDLEFIGNGIVPYIKGQKELEQLICSTQIYKPDPNKIIKPGPVGTGEEIVNSDTSNLIGFLDRMLGNKYRRTVFNKIEDDLHKCIPEFNQIELDDAISTDESISVYGEKSRKNSFKRLGLISERTGITYWADELSEGTLYFLALLCIINQPNPPKLLLLEEPEKGIHPRRIREVMNFIRRLVVEKDIQVIMTTHSPVLVDEFAESPESVFVFDKNEDGATLIRNLLHEVIIPADRENERLGIPLVPYTEDLGEYWTIGFLGGVPHEAD